MFDTYYIYFYYINWYIDEAETMSKEALIEELYQQYVPSPEQEYSSATQFKPYVIENGEEIPLFANVISVRAPGTFCYSVCENGEYEIVIKNTDDEEILSEKIIINDILTVNNPAIVPADGDWKVDSNGDLVSYSGQESNVVVPLKIGDTKVSHIGETLFKDNKTIQSVIISEGIKTIDTYSFLNCSNLTSVKLPSNLEAIWQSSFNNCTSLKEITIPNGTKFPLGSPFSGCTDITFTFEAGPNEVPDGFPWGATNATLIDLNNPTE